MESSSLSSSEEYIETYSYPEEDYYYFDKL